MEEKVEFIFYKSLVLIFRWASCNMSSQIYLALRLSVFELLRPIEKERLFWLSSLCLTKRSIPRQGHVLYVSEVINRVADDDFRLSSYVVHLMRPPSLWYYSSISQTRSCLLAPGHYLKRRFFDLVDCCRFLAEYVFIEIVFNKLLNSGLIHD